MNSINFHHSTENRTSVDGSLIVELLVKVIETHFTNNDTCEAASDALSHLLIEPSIQPNQFNFSFHFTDKLSNADCKIARKAIEEAKVKK